MRFYECIFIVHPSVPEEEIDQITNVVLDVIKSDNGEVIKIDKWGKRKLAYEVKKERYGYYIYLYFKASGPIIKEMDRRMKLHEKIIRHLTVTTEQKSKEELQKETMAHVPAAPEPVKTELVAEPKNDAVPETNSGNDIEPESDSDSEPISDPEPEE